MTRVRPCWQQRWSPAGTDGDEAALDDASRGRCTLCIAHHDPSQTDDDIDQKLSSTEACLAAKGSQVRVVAPAEGDRLRI